MEPLAAAFGPLLPFFNQLRPTKSPFILVMTAIVVVLVTLETPSDNFVSYLFHGIIYFLLLSIIVLSLKFRPPEVERMASEDITEDEKNVMRLEIDGQYKFARAICLSAAIFSLWNISNNFYYTIEFFIAFFVCFSTIIIFLFYMIIRNIREESTEKYAIFQISAITAAIVISASTLLKEESINYKDGSFLWNCRMVYTLIRPLNFEEIEKQKKIGDFPSLAPATDADEEEIAPPQIVETDECKNQDIIKHAQIYKGDKSTENYFIDFKASTFWMMTISWVFLLIFWIARLRNIFKLRLLIIS